jgi:hypothetical protein
MWERKVLKYGYHALRTMSRINKQDLGLSNDKQDNTLLLH